MLSPSGTYASLAIVPAVPIWLLLAEMRLFYLAEATCVTVYQLQ